MTKACLVILVVVLLAVVASPAWAQGNDPIPACTQAQLNEFNGLMREHLARMSDLIDASLESDWDKAAGIGGAISVEWITNTLPELPNCAYALRFGNLATGIFYSGFAMSLAALADLDSYSDNQFEIMTALIDALSKMEP